MGSTVPGEPCQFVLREPQRSGCHVGGQVVGIAGARYGQDVRALVQRPGQPDLRDGGSVCAGYGEQFVVVPGARALLAPRAG